MLQQERLDHLHVLLESFGLVSSTQCLLIPVALLDVAVFGRGTIIPQKSVGDKPVN